MFTLAEKWVPTAGHMFGTENMYVFPEVMIGFGSTVEVGVNTSVFPFDVAEMFFINILCPTVSPTAILNTPFAVQIALLTGVAEKPVIVDEMLDAGLNMPILYRITATMTMISIAQP